MDMENKNTDNLIPATPKDVRAALKRGCVYHVWGDGERVQIIAVRMLRGTMQVKHLRQGISTWVTPVETSRLVQM